MKKRIWFIPLVMSASLSGLVFGFDVPYRQDFEGAAEGTIPVGLGWSAGPGDQSTVVSNRYAYTGISPLSGSTHDQVLDLQTGSASVAVPFSVDGSQNTDLYFDAMRRFAATTDDVSSILTQDREIKYAYCLNTNGNLVLYHGGADGNTDAFTVLDGRFTPGTWHRLTVEMDMAPVAGNPVPFFRVKVDGTVQSGATTGFSQPSTNAVDYAGGSWFRFAHYAGQFAGGTHQTIRQYAFSGTGKVDDFVLRRVDPALYETWFSTYGLTNDPAVMDANPDGDGLDNLGEYALGGDPANSGDMGHVPSVEIALNGGTNWCQYVYAMRNDAAERGLNYLVETSTNLVSDAWTTNGIAMYGTGVLDADFLTVTNRLSTESTDEQFMRLRVEFRE